jgi:hypothetical protein
LDDFGFDFRGLFLPRCKQQCVYVHSHLLMFDVPFVEVGGGGGRILFSSGLTMLCLVEEWKFQNSEFFLDVGYVSLDFADSLLWPVPVQD